MAGIQTGGRAAYISRRRLHQAGLDLLRYPDMSVTDVAYGLGFKGLSDFSRAFRRDFLMTPRDYRAMNGASSG